MDRETVLRVIRLEFERRGIITPKTDEAILAAVQFLSRYDVELFDTTEALTPEPESPEKKDDKGKDEKGGE